MTNVVAIHQPNFFPWLGYFDKIARADAFIFLDDVQYQKTGGMWSNRVKLFIGGAARWMTAPIDRAYHGVRTINQMHFLPADPWREKMRKTLETNYRKHPHFYDSMQIIEPLINHEENNIAAYNIHAVTTLMQHLEMDVSKLHRSSILQVAGQSNERLCALTRAVGGSSYMCGGGADGYQDDAAFAAAGIGLIYQDFLHPVYSQSGAKEFVSGLSIIDALMNIGVVGVRSGLKARGYL
jgi:hypothetical protein